MSQQQWAGKSQWRSLEKRYWRDHELLKCGKELGEEKRGYGVENPLNILLDIRVIVSYSCLRDTEYYGST